MVSVPSDHLIAVRGHPAVLGCHFTPYPDLSSLVIVWLRQEDSRIVPSFYYEQNQLDHQSPEYHKRTSLYISELGKGNASLRIDGVGLKDVAFYSEPRLSIHANSTTVMVQFESEGFPKPEVTWLDEHGQSLIHHLELHNQTEDGLYLVKSSYEAQKPVVNVTFTLKNNLLNQKLLRPVIFSYDAGGAVTVPVIVLSVVCVILSGFITVYMLRGVSKSTLALYGKCQKHLKESLQTSGTES
ncbi:hypothetical protein ABG768_005467 [Culter alburnus]|uniref:Butyrophilin subfamily 3 member A2-like Ig-C domain-containing protein n=1 Tax=Culter alburnus TaxID=194366 RepID=A0AAW1ZSA1_CULAL